MSTTTCYRRSNSIICEFIANSQQKDVEFTINGASAIYDQDGNKYFSNFVSIANWNKPLKKGYGELRAELVKSVDTKISIQFDADEGVVSVSKAFVGAYVDAQWIPFSFRDITMNVN